MLHGKTIAVGVTGGIAAYKACEVVSLLKKAGAEVHVVMTRNATEFVSPLTFETLSNNRVITDAFSRDFEYNVKHVSLSKKADLFLIAPCTANTAAKIALGIADDFLSTAVMAATCPLVLAPAMNTNMLNSAAYRENEKILKSRGVKFVETETGRLACGDSGDGRLAEPKKIVESVCSVLFPVRDYAGKTVLITAGATSEPIDPVRFITNRSSGKMGAALARAAVGRGARVIFIAGSISVVPDSDWQTERVETTQEMYDAVMNNLPAADIIIKSAAPADYRAAAPATQKIKSEKLTLEFVKNPDIAAAVGKIKGGKKLVVFAAETENLLQNARKKLKAKNADMVVANDVTLSGAGFGSDNNAATLITASDSQSTELIGKPQLAHIILDKILTL
jgi:phosphopantothenoylcysteine decarboxylase/phosphopantothenate--cysteine ligase